MEQSKKFDVVVIGGGHAGLEAAWIASSFDLDVALISFAQVPLGSAPCNPAIGGIGKAQIVREIDALGGLMGVLADQSAIQFRTLNESRGAAVRSTRAQIDKDIYPQLARQEIERRSNIKIISVAVNAWERRGKAYHLETDIGTFQARELIVTAGTFLKGRMHTGPRVTQGGRVDAKDSAPLLGPIEPNPKRFKTGTPARIFKGSVNYDLMEEQPSDGNSFNFHCLHEENERFLPQVSCHLTRTNSKTMEIIHQHKEKSPMYNGQITAIGARYCPSIEDKAFRYPEKEVHHVFVEPEGLQRDTIYPNGVSTSLPFEIQKEFIQTIQGLEKAEIAVAGYAVEYDVLNTKLLDQTLQHKLLPNLSFAGQINGTSGYEEAAAQGFVAGLNASMRLLGEDPVIFSRYDSYIGVLIQDLVTEQRDEPYRLFTARAENRLFLREDNVLLRMWPYRSLFKQKKKLDLFYKDFHREWQILSSLMEKTKSLSKNGQGELSSMTEALKDPKIDPVSYFKAEIHKLGGVFSDKVLRTFAISSRYAGYIERAKSQYKKMEKLDGLKIDWNRLSQSTNVSFECRQRIIQEKPETFLHLKKIPGIRSATLTVASNELY